MTANAYGIGNRYAENFSIESSPTHKLLTIRSPWRGGEQLSYRYALVGKGKRVPELPESVRIIRTPAERILILATVFLGPIQELGMHEKLVGVSNLDLISDPKVHGLVQSGHIRKVQTGSALDIESILALKPDLILTSATGNALFDTHPQLERAHLPFVLTAGYMENHPLARAEWIKVVGALTGKETEAKAVFEATAHRYEYLATLVPKTAHRPTVFSNAPYAGIWHVPGGKSYTAQTLSDAGADYLWADHPSSGGVPLDFEVIFATASQADFWINPSFHDSLETLLAADRRFGSFKSFRTGNVFNNTVRRNANGGNDVWERGFQHPDEILADLIKIFHPELLPNHAFIYYEKLE